MFDPPVFGDQVLYLDKVSRDPIPYCLTISPTLPNVSGWSKLVLNTYINSYKMVARCIIHFP